MEYDLDLRRLMIDWEEPKLSISRQCELLGLPRSSLYYEPAGESLLDLKIMRLIDRQYLRTPFFGSRKMRIFLNQLGYPVGRERVQTLMRKMGIEALYPKPRLSKRDVNHKIYPYLLRGLDIVRVNQVWSSDITYLPLDEGFAYLVAVIDWFSRHVLSWEISTTLECEFCVKALEKALKIATPEIFNTDQGSQFTANDFTAVLKGKGIQISMDSRGRAFDNIFMERLWRSYKYEYLYLADSLSVPTVRQGI